MTEPLDLDAIERGDVSVCTCYPSCCEDNLALIAEVKRLREDGNIYRKAIVDLLDVDATGAAAVVEDTAFIAGLGVVGTEQLRRIITDAQRAIDERTARRLNLARLQTSAPGSALVRTK